jgi:hypothetical protein
MPNALDPRRLVGAELGRSRSGSSGQLARWTAVSRRGNGIRLDWTVPAADNGFGGGVINYPTDISQGTPATAADLLHHRLDEHQPPLAGGKSAHTRFPGACPVACGPTRQRIQPLPRRARPSLHRRSPRRRT